MIKTPAVIVTICLLGLAGCAAQPGDAPVRSEQTLGPLRPGESPEVQVFGQARQWVGLSSPTVTRSMGGPIRVSMPVRSMSDEPMALEYRYEFFDRAGQLMTPAMDWTPVMLPAYGQVHVEAPAPPTSSSSSSSNANAGAANWRLLIRPAD